MVEHPNVRRLRDVYAAFDNADLNCVLDDFADDAVVHFKGEGPSSGDRKGREAIAAALIGRFELTGGTHKFEVHDIFADDDHGVAVIRETATRQDGAMLDVEEAHMVTFNAAGKITNVWDLPADAGAHDRFFDGR
jgi:ketosteroid isomerase-like protein